jgi:hypothetical protein
MDYLCRSLVDFIGMRMYVGVVEASLKYKRFPAQRDIDHAKIIQVD